MGQTGEGRRPTAAQRRIAGEEGQALIEYALILGLIAVASIGALNLLGHGISDILGGVSSSLASVANP